MTRSCRHHDLVAEGGRHEEGNRLDPAHPRDLLHRHEPGSGGGHRPQHRGLHRGGVPRHRHVLSRSDHVTRILCAGLATVDLVYRVDRVPGVDEKAQATGLAVAAGGPAANAAVTAAALGSEVTLVTAIGSHPLGALIRADLTSHGVRIIDASPDSAEPPPVSAISVLARTGQRTIVS